MRVKVRAFAMLRRYLPDQPLGRAAEVDLPSGATLGEALERLGIPLAETKSCFVNGLQQDPGYTLEEGDELGLFPPIAGGRSSPAVPR